MVFRKINARQELYIICYMFVYFFAIIISYHFTFMLMTLNRRRTKAILSSLSLCLFAFSCWFSRMRPIWKRDTKCTDFVVFVSRKYPVLQSHGHKTIFTSIPDTHTNTAPPSTILNNRSNEYQAMFFFSGFLQKPHNSRQIRNNF